MFDFKNPGYPPLLAYVNRAEVYRKRVEADGGTVFNINAVIQAYMQADIWNINTVNSHWSSPQFGYKLDSNGQVTTRYGLFGHDAVVSSASLNWLLVPSVNNKAPQHNTNNVGFTIPGWTWQTISCLVHIVSNASSYTTSHYNYFPMLELTPAMGSNVYPLILSVEQSNGAEGGSSSSYISTGSMPSINTQHAYAFQYDPSQASTSDMQKLWVDGISGTISNGSGSIPSSLPNNSEFILGIRGGVYNWQGNINDVFITNKVLSQSARSYLDSQVNAY